jgi:hypothetical protein
VNPCSVPGTLAGLASGTAYRAELVGMVSGAARVQSCGVCSVGPSCSFHSVFAFLIIVFEAKENMQITLNK